jgi:hypothetical protein
VAVAWRMPSLRLEVQPLITTECAGSNKAKQSLLCAGSSVSHLSLCGQNPVNCFRYFPTTAHQHGHSSRKACIPCKPSLPTLQRRSHQWCKGSRPRKHGAFKS